VQSPQDPDQKRSVTAGEAPHPEEPVVSTRLKPEGDASDNVSAILEDGGSPVSSRPSQTSSARATWLADLYLAGLIVIVFIADQLSKGWIRDNLIPGRSIPDEGFFRLTHISNTGSAFGLFPDQTLVLMLASLVGIGILLVFFRKQSDRGIWLRASLGLQLGGAIGNLADRLTLGGVTDFIDVGPWPIFNLADSSIVVGIILLAWMLYNPSKKPAAVEGPPSPDETSESEGPV
jgi:signal peptidase II